MPYFFIPFIIGAVGLVVVWFSDNPRVFLPGGILSVFICLSAFPVMFSIDIPNRDRGDIIPLDTCIECKMIVYDNFYAIGCDGHEYHINMSTWALLNISRCD